MSLPNREVVLLFKASPDALLLICVFCAIDGCDYLTGFFIPKKPPSRIFGAHRVCLESVQLDWRGRPSEGDMRGHILGTSRVPFEGDPRPVGALCGAPMGDNDGTCPNLRCIRLPGHVGLHDNVNGDPVPPASVIAIPFEELPDGARAAFHSSWFPCDFTAESGLPGGGTRYTARNAASGQRWTWLSARGRWALHGEVAPRSEVDTARKLAAGSIYGKMGVK